MKTATTTVRDIERERDVAQLALDKLAGDEPVDDQLEIDTIKEPVEKMTVGYDYIVEILNKLPFGTYKDQVKEYSTAMGQLIEYWTSIATDLPEQSADEPAPDPEPDPNQTQTQSKFWRLNAPLTGPYDLHLLIQMLIVNSRVHTICTF